LCAMRTFSWSICRLMREDKTPATIVDMLAQHQLSHVLHMFKYLLVTASIYSTTLSCSPDGPQIGCVYSRS
jgi:hypothetical protein